MKGKKLLEDAVTYIILTLISIISLLPVYWMFITSFKQSIDTITYPPKFIFNPTLSNYIAVFTAPLGGQITLIYRLANSLIASISAVVASLIIGVPAAYAIARYDFPYKESIYFTYITFRFLPPFVVILALFIMYGYFGLLDTLLGLTLVYILIALPMTIWLMVGFFEQVPKEIEEAALLDGCSGLNLFTKILIPLVSPGIASTLIMSFIFCWNDFIFGLTLTSIKAQPLQVALSLYISYGEVYWGQMAAAGVISMLPILVFFGIVQKYLARGLTFGAVKG